MKGFGWCVFLMPLVCPAILGHRAAGQMSEAALALPPSPGFLLQAPQSSRARPRTPCVPPFAVPVTSPEALSAEQARDLCPMTENPYQRFLDSETPIPLTPRQKAYLAYHDVKDPFNLLTILANALFTVGINSHSAYGPGLKGIGKVTGYSLVEDMTGEFIGTFGVCSLLHEDPHYHRLAQGPAGKRLVHALERTIIAQHDNGKLMPNYENFITYPASAEISNLYVPGIHGDGPSTVARIFTGLATDPVNNIITEFLPDFARHFHVRIVFVQQILNQIATSPQL